MQNKFLLRLFIMIAIVVFIAAPNLVYPQASENRIAIILDKKIYSPNDNVIITLTNLSNETLTFATWEYDLELQIWNGALWKDITWYHKQALNSLGPHENATVVLRDLIDQQGTYRVGTLGVWAEFEVREGDMGWSMLTIVGIMVAVVVTIATAYFLKTRKRG